MQKFAFSSDEPVVVIALSVPLRLASQLMALVAVAVAPAEKPCVETTAVERPSRPGITRVRQASGVVPLHHAIRKVG